MSALSDLRAEAARHPDGSTAKRILTWAEIHIADQFDVISELEEDNKRMYAECAALRQALLAIETSAAELAEQACAAAGITDAHLHDLRAKGMTDTERQGNNAQTLGGHTDRRTTQIYIRLRDTPTAEPPAMPGKGKKQTG